MPILTILFQNEQYQYDVPLNANLRKMLLQHNHSPYVQIIQKLNCGGRGICATCGVWIESTAPKPTHWHDSLANTFGYPRLSCQVTITEDMTIRILDDKVIWGGRKSKK